MQSSLRAGIARIDVVHQGRSISRGTGFLVTDDLALTALHVVADRSKESLTLYPGEIVLTFPDHPTTRAVVHEHHFDRSADWALLKCETAPAVRPLPLAELRTGGVAWETYGFPDASPRDGMVNIGEVSNHLGTWEGNPVFQLFSREAAAGQGAPVKGLSGSPVIVQNAVVGLLRIALMKEQQAVAGTVYGCPIASVLAKTAALLPQPDPCFGLPGLPRQPLPAEPFRYLSWFTSREAEVFFGRNREIRQTYDRLTSDQAPPVTLLYGQSGVGKSSFLDAGLMPRLSWYHEVRYVRRDATTSLLQTLCRILQQAGGPTGTLADWLAIEGKARRPLIVFFDQIEEIYTRPNQECLAELEELVGELKQLFEGAHPPRGRLVLSFRKEWFPEIQKQMEVHGLSYGKVFLEGLDRDAIIEVVNGLTQTDRLRQRYGLKIEDRLPEEIANDLVEDRDSPIAPTLQILLTKMWRKATSKSQSAPEETIDLYQTLKREGLLLGDFLDQQIEALKGKQAPWVESGLVLDVLAFHTTSLLTAKERSSGELAERYSHRQDMPGLVQEMATLFLVSDTSGENEQKTTRLSHDTLAPTVRQRFEHSEKPGQRARRILESRAGDWQEGSEAGLLDAASLAVVKSGLSGMCVVNATESLLIEASETQQQRRQRNRFILRSSAVAAGLLVCLASAYAFYKNFQYEAQKEQTYLQAAVARSSRLLESNPAKALILAISSVGRSLRLKGLALPEVQENLNWALTESREETVVYTESVGLANEQAGPPLDWSSEGLIATLGFPPGDGDQQPLQLQFWDLTGSRPLGRIDVPSGSADKDQKDLLASAALAFSADGALLAIGYKQDISLWDRAGQRVGIPFAPNTRAKILDLAFTPDQKMLMSGSDDGLVRAWDLTGTLLWEAVGSDVKGVVAAGEHSEHSGGVVGVAAARTPQNQLLIATGGSDGTVRLWSEQGKPIFKFVAQKDVAVIAMAVTPERSIVIATGSMDDNEDGVRIWNTTGKLLRTVPYSNRSVCGLRFSPRGDVLAVAVPDDGSVRFVDPATGADVLWPFYTRESYLCPGMAFDLSGGRLAVKGQSGTLHFVDTRRDNLRQTLAVAGGDSLRIVRFSPNGRLIAAAGEKGRIYLWDPQIAAMREIAPVNAGATPITALAFSVDGTRLASAGSGVVRLWSTKGDLLAALREPVGSEAVMGPLAFTPDDHRLLSGVFTESAGWNIRVWDPEGNRSRLFWDDQRENNTPPRRLGLAISPDGTRIASTGGDKTIHLWDVDGRPSEQLQLNAQALVRFSSDSKRMLTREWDGLRNVVRSWTLPAREGPPEPITFRGFGKSYSPEQVTQSGEYIFVAGPSVTVWDGASHERVAEFTGYRGEAGSITVSPDGTTVASAGTDGTVRLFRATWKQWLDAACERIRYHPMLIDPKAGEEADREDTELARQTCQELAWKRNTP